MFYDITGLCRRTDINMGSHGFCIKLYPQWKELVASFNKTQEDCEVVLNNIGRLWLDACGFDSIFDPDNYGFDKDGSKPLGLNAHPLYEPNRDLRVTWGEWGLEHITVPGNACGLDINSGIGAPLNGGRILSPHNIDTINQKMLLLIVFTWFAENMGLNHESNLDI